VNEVTDVRELVRERDDALAQIGKLEEALMAAVETARNEATKVAILEMESSKLHRRIAALHLRLGEMLSLIDHKQFQPHENQLKIFNARNEYNTKGEPT